MRVVGLDGGTRRVGVALSDELGLTAQPLATIIHGTDDEIIARLRGALGDARPDLVVVGLPLRLDGTEGGAARAARRLAALVHDRLAVPCELWDERLTSAQAERVLIDAGLSRERRRGPTDRVAAAIMLQSFLDAHQDRCRERDR
jgi:putative Holliday junction resolvase